MTNNCFKIGNVIWTGPEEYVWSVDHTEVTYHNWDLYEPDDTEGTDNCVQVHYETGRWHDENCRDFIGFVCRAPISSSTSTSYVKTRRIVC